MSNRFTDCSGLHTNDGNRGLEKKWPTDDRADPLMRNLFVGLHCYLRGHFSVCCIDAEGLNVSGQCCESVAIELDGVPVILPFGR
jgi:hypothetical protein